MIICGIHFINQIIISSSSATLQWRHNGHDGVSNHQPNDCLLNCLFRRRSKKTSKLRVTGLYAGNSPVTGEFPAQIASNAENVSIWLRHHETIVEVRAWMSNYTPLSYVIILPRFTGTITWLPECWRSHSHSGNHIIHYNDYTMGLWRFKSPATGRFIQRCV